MSALIRGRVRGPNGQPVAGAAVAFSEAPAPVPDIAALTDAAGAFALDAPAAGRYVVRCYAAGYRPAEERVMVAGEQAVEVEFRLIPA